MAGAGCKSLRVPPAITVLPVYEFVPPKRSVAVPVFVNDPLPLMACA